MSQYTGRTITSYKRASAHGGSVLNVNKAAACHGVSGRAYEWSSLERADGHTATRAAANSPNGSLVRPKWMSNSLSERARGAKLLRDIGDSVAMNGGSSVLTRDRNRLQVQCGRVF
jgi:hypothetical protein